MASDLGLQHPDTITILAVWHFSGSKKYRKIKFCRMSVVDSTLHKLALRACYKQYETLLQGQTPQRLQIIHQDGSVAVPRIFAASCSVVTRLESRRQQLESNRPSQNIVLARSVSDSQGEYVGVRRWGSGGPPPGEFCNLTEQMVASPSFWTVIL